MSDYQPKPGDKAHLTVGVTVDEIGDYRDQDGRIIACAGDPIIVKVVPAPVVLPTGFGARISATLKWSDGDVPNVRLAFSGIDDGSGDWVVHPADRGQAGCVTVFSDRLSDVEVLDPGEPT